MSKANFFNIRGRGKTLDLSADRLMMLGNNRGENGTISISNMQ